MGRAPASRPPLGVRCPTGPCRSSRPEARGPTIAIRSEMPQMHARTVVPYSGTGSEPASGLVALTLFRPGARFCRDRSPRRAATSRTRLRSYRLARARGRRMRRDRVDAGHRGAAPLRVSGGRDDRAPPAANPTRRRHGLDAEVQRHTPGSSAIGRRRLPPDRETDCDRPAARPSACLESRPEDDAGATNRRSPRRTSGARSASPAGRRPSAHRPPTRRAQAHPDRRLRLQRHEPRDYERTTSSRSRWRGAF